MIPEDVSDGWVTLLPALRPKAQPGMLSGRWGSAPLAVENRAEDAALERPEGSRSQETRR